MSEGTLRHGMLTSGRTWELSESRRSAITEGKHFIVAPVGDAPGTPAEEAELLAIALQIGAELAPEAGRWRIGFNGPGQRVRPHSHVHIICPAGKDTLPRLTDKITAS